MKAFLSALMSSRFLVHAAWWTALLGGAIQYTVKDRWLLTGVIHYALPLPVLVAAFGCTALLWMSQKQHWMAVASVMLSFLCLVGWYARDHVENVTVSSPSDRVSVLYWNAWHPKHDPISAIQPLVNRDPDIIVVVESGALIEAIQEKSPDWTNRYAIGDLGQCITVMAKGGISTPTMERYGRKNKVGTCTVALPESTLRLMVCDFGSNPFYSRHAAMKRAIEINSVTPADIVVGDFNTPTDSMTFEVLRNEYNEAFEVAGNGWHATWPSPLPLTALDHVWVRNDRATLYAKIIRSIRSDHSMIWVEFDP